MVVIGKRGAGARTGIRVVTVYPAGVVAGGRMVATGAVTATGATVVVTTEADLAKDSADGKVQKGIQGAADSVIGAGGRGRPLDQGAWKNGNMG